MIPRGLALLCPLPLSECSIILSFGRQRGGYDHTESGTIVRPSALVIRKHSSVRTLTWRVWPYWVLYCGVPTLSLDTDVSPPLTRE